jgi:hypothetical protein
MAGEVLVWEGRYSSPGIVKLPPKYSSLMKIRKVKNKASTLHSSWSGEKSFVNGGKKSEE